MLKSKLKILFAILLSLITSCASPPDVPLCTEINPAKGFCVYTLSAKEFEVTDEKKWNDKTWWELRPNMILMPVDSWVEIKAFIIKICKKSNKCSGQNITGWERSVKAIDENLVN